MNIKIFSDTAATARAAAVFIAAECRAAIAARSRFVAAFCGGTTPWLMLRALADEEVQWREVQVLQVDERIAPAGDPDRNLTHLHESLLDTSLRPEQIHVMPVESENLDEAAAQYARTIADLAGVPPVLDLAHLGLGADGHTASLVPGGDPVLEVTRADIAITQPYQGRRQMTMTYPIINRTRRILWLVTGVEKKAMLRRLLQAGGSIPAGRVRRDGAVIFADRPAAVTP